MIDKQKLINVLDENLPSKSEVNKITTQATKVSIISGILDIVNSGQLDFCEQKEEEANKILPNSQQETPFTKNIKKKKQKNK